MSSAAVSFAPVAARTQVPIRLAMQRLWLAGRVLPAGARLVVQHVFRSDEDQPLEVIYAFPLPRDAALRAFRITGEGFEAHSELKPVEEAVRAYEKGIADGSLSTLARTYGDGVVNLTVGNIRPKETVTVWLEVLAGVELRDDGFRFRFPFTLAPAYHSEMRAAMVAGEGEMELPASEFGDVILPRFREDAASLHEVGFELQVAHQLPIGEIGSPSHAISVRQDGEALARVALGAGQDVPNRDLVLDVRFKEPKAQVLAGPSEAGKRSFAVIAPSTLFGVNPGTPRRTVILLDRSGSMQGAPIAQARKAIEACLAVLTAEDSFGLVAFDDQVETMHRGLLAGTREHRDRARAFLQQVDARGGTELAKGVVEAAQLLEGGGDVVVLTDGQVSGTESILAQARAAHVRLFCLGIGSASQDRFLSLLARETGGISRFVTARERVDLAAVDLFASMGRPVATGVKAGVNVQPESPASVFAGTPLLLFGETEAGGSHSVGLAWDGGRTEFPVPEGDSETGETVRLLRGSRLITDWESCYPSEEAVAPLEKRKQSRVAARLAELSATYGLASREMALVAVVKRAGDRAGELPETRVVPVGMPQDVSFDAYFRAPQAPAMAAGYVATQVAAVPPTAAPHRGAMQKLARFSILASRRLVQPAAAREEASEDDALLELAAALEPDGGRPGDTIAVRAARTIAALLAFLAAGHTPTAGAFRSHVARLVEFLRSAGGLSANEEQVVERALGAAKAGHAPKGDWLGLARGPVVRWRHLEKALGQ